jgi:signal transduction histidine kinase
MADRTRSGRHFAGLASIRARLTAAACLVVAGALLVGAAVILTVLRHTLDENLDDAAVQRAKDVAAQVESSTLDTPLPVHGDEDAYIDVRAADGHAVARTSNLKQDTPVATFRPEDDDPEIRTQKIPVRGEEDDFRIVALNAQGPTYGAVTIYVVASLDRVKETATAVRHLLRWGVPLLVALVGAIAWFVVGRALRPVEAMRAEVAEITAQDLGRRVPVPRARDEIGRLATTMNDMLDRLQHSAERERRFVADASHELQSPLASSLADLEVALAHPESTEWEATARAVVADNERMTRLVGDLLFLAQSDNNGASQARRTLVDLDDVVREEVSRLRPPEGLVVDVSGVTPAEVRGDADQLARVVRNLLENASRYARTTITVGVSTNGTGRTELTVADDGPGVPADERDRIFERFTRLDDSRSRATGGTGLGLAIAREIVESHRGTIDLDQSASGARFVVQLPAAG